MTRLQPRSVGSGRTLTAFPLGKAPQPDQELGNEGHGRHLLSSCELVASQASPDKRSEERDKVPVREGRAHVIIVSSGFISQVYVPNTAAINCRGVRSVLLREYWKFFYMFGDPFLANRGSYCYFNSRF